MLLWSDAQKERYGISQAPDAARGRIQQQKHKKGVGVKSQRVLQPRELGSRMVGAVGFRAKPRQVCSLRAAALPKKTRHC